MPGGGHHCEPAWDEVDLDRPNVARIYDYYLGGTANYAVDRVFADQALARFPFIRPACHANRLFLRRVVRHLIKQGVRQFVDIGAGVPTMGCTHQVAEDLTATARVVYVDNEPVALTYSQILLDQDGDPSRHAVVQADLRDPDTLWAKVAATHVIDMSKPVALLVIAVLHMTQPGPDGTDIAPDVIAQYRDLLPAGSYLAISHGTTDGAPDDLAAQMTEMGKMYDTTPTPVIWRSHAEIEMFFGDFTLIEPGATWTPLWHPEATGSNPPHVPDFDSPAHSVVWAGVGHKH